MFLGLLAFVAFHLLIYAPPKALPGREAGVAESRRPVWNPPPEEALPDNEDGVFRFDRNAAASKLCIVPRGEQGHLVLKIEDATDSKLVCWFFIRQGQSADIAIPAGTYRLKLARGQKWYGEKHLFGPSASYSAISNRINIPIYTAYTIDLHPNTDGTLRVEKLGSNDF